MKYEIGKTYRTRVETTDVFCSIHFKFFSDKCVLIKDVYDGDWSSYTLTPSVEIHHDAPDGTWILRVHVGCQPDWLFRREGLLYVPTIYEVKGKHYDAIVEDDMGAYTTEKEDVEEEVKQVIEWCRKTKGIDFGNPLQPKITLQPSEMRTGIITNITEGGNEMHKELYHVILFNRKTEKIDFKAYITARDEAEAGMTAAHNYDEYDSNVHKHIVKMIEGSEYEAIK